MTDISDKIRSQIDDLNTRYIRAIDDDKLEDWPALFAERCLYKITTRENYDRNLPMSLMECTSRGMLNDRVTGYRRINIYEPQRYTHMISGRSITAIDATHYSCRESFMVVRTMINGEMSIFSTGIYHDKIVIGADGAQFEERVVVQESRRVDVLLVIPL